MIFNVQLVVATFVYSVLEHRNTTSMHATSRSFIPCIDGPLGELLVSNIGLIKKKVNISITIKHFYFSFMYMKCSSI